MADNRKQNSVDGPFNDNEPVNQVFNCALCQCHQSRTSFEQRCDSDSFHRRDRLYEMEERSHEPPEIQHYYRSGGNGRGRYKQLQLAIEKMMVSFEEDGVDEREFTMDDLAKGRRMRKLRKRYSTSVTEKAMKRYSERTVEESFQIDASVENVKLEDLKFYDIKVEDDCEGDGDLSEHDVDFDTSIDSDPDLNEDLKTEKCLKMPYLQGDDVVQETNLVHSVESNEGLVKIERSVKIANLIDKHWIGERKHFNPVVTLTDISKMFPPKKDSIALTKLPIPSIRKFLKEVTVAKKMVPVPIKPARKFSLCTTKVPKKPVYPTFASSSGAKKTEQLIRLIVPNPIHS